jgi:heat shock protein HslJ
MLASCESVGFGGFKDGEVKSLNGTSWTLKSYGPKSQQISVAADIAVTMIISDSGQSATGLSGCNRYSGSVVLDGKRITIGPTAGTRMACTATKDEMERIYLGALASTKTYHMTGNSLSIKYGDDGVLTCEADLTD